MTPSAHLSLSVFLYPTLFRSVSNQSKKASASCAEQWYLSLHPLSVQHKTLLFLPLKHRCGRIGSCKLQKWRRKRRGPRFTACEKSQTCCAAALQATLPRACSEFVRSLNPPTSLLHSVSLEFLLQGLSIYVALRFSQYLESLFKHECFSQNSDSL